MDCDNRLVAQTLEDEWETSMAECRRLGDACDRYCHEVPTRLTPEEQDLIRRSASGIAELWDGGCLSTPEKAELLRLMISRVSATIIDETGRVEIEILWHGGDRTRAGIRRPVRQISRPSYYAGPCTRVRTLKEEGRNHADIAETLNAQEEPVQRRHGDQTREPDGGRQSRQEAGPVLACDAPSGRVDHG